jgi:hypothetical protein
MAVVAEEKPELVILCGPFVDVMHPLIQDSKLIEQTYEEVFYDNVIAKINKALMGNASPNTRVVLVPSERDVHHDFVFPTPPFELARDESGAGVYECHGNTAAIHGASVRFAPSYELRTVILEHPSVYSYRGGCTGNISFARNPSTIRCKGNQPSPSLPDSHGICMAYLTGRGALLQGSTSAWRPST